MNAMTIVRSRRTITFSISTRRISASVRCAVARCGRWSADLHSDASVDKRRLRSPFVILARGCRRPKNPVKRVGLLAKNPGAPPRSPENQVKTVGPLDVRTASRPKIQSRELGGSRRVDGGYPDCGGGVPALVILSEAKNPGAPTRAARNLADATEPRLANETS